MTPINNGYFAVPIPEDAPTDPQRYGITHIFHGEDILYYTDDEGKSVPIGNVGSQSFKVICTSKSITEKQVAKIVDIAIHMEDHERMVKDGWWNYEGGNPFKTALESFHSLLRSLNLTANYAIIKKL